MELHILLPRVSNGQVTELNLALPVGQQAKTKILSPLKSAVNLSLALMATAFLLFTRTSQTVC